MIKLENRIKYDFEIDLSPYTVDQNLSAYELFAVTCHLGTGSQGHYVSYVLREHPIDKNLVWVMYDDDEVSIENSKNILELSAYLLFYRKKSLPTSTYVNYMLQPLR
jgi:ubiquitin C-terminal hydrolase